jgi:hypothetical protein
MMTVTRSYPDVLVDALNREASAWNTGLRYEYLHCEVSGSEGRRSKCVFPASTEADAADLEAALAYEAAEGRKNLAAACGSRPEAGRGGRRGT